MSDGIFIAVICTAALLMLVLAKVSGGKHSIRRTLLCIGSGIAALCLVNAASAFTGIALPVSRLSLCVAGFLGLPGVTSMLIIQALF